jgi:type II secretory pathway pseudopilin PulG
MKYECYRNKGLSLVEALISIFLISALLAGILGAFVISRLGVDRAKHRMMAMNTIREYMEQEIRAGYLGGFGARPDPPGGEDADYYLTVDDGNPINFVIDDMGTISSDDDLTGTIRPDPYPAETYEQGVPPNSCRYKKVGFVVEWDEKLFGGATLPTSRERTAAFVADHS